MSRPLRIEYPGSLHHVSSRGNARQNIFLDDRDRAFFLDSLGTCVERFSWILTAYVLMSNHFHLVIQLTDETLSKGLQWLNGKYSQAFNRRHRRVGHLFQGRPDIRLIEKESYGLEVLRYVVLNPVRARLVAKPEDYPWSSQRAAVGDVPAPDWLAVDDLLVQFAPARTLARAAYRQFVNAAIGSKESPWTDLVGQMYLGSDEWMETVRDRMDLELRSDAHPRLQRRVASPTMGEVIRAVADGCSIDEAWIRCGRGGVPRMVAAWIAWYDGQLTNSEIAAGLRIRSAGHVTRLVHRCDRKLQEDIVLRNSIDQSLSTLRRKRTRKALTP